jgi:hypothetical protein
MTTVGNQNPGLLVASPAIFRRQSRHRQSPPSTGIGRRAVSSAHQHDPARLQVNSVPHPEQARRREAGLSNRFVINRTESCLRFSCRVHVDGIMIRKQIYASDSPGKA